MKSAEQVRVENVPLCLLCNSEGTQLYEGLRDRTFGARGTWGFMRCQGCGFIWLNPRPVPEDLGKVYAAFFTHTDEHGRFGLASFRERLQRAMCAAVPGYGSLAPSWGWRQLGRALNLFPPLREAGRLGTMYLNGSKKGKLLDVGCGNGHFLALMRDAGWEVLGIEWDPEAAKVARGVFGVPVIVGTLPAEELPAGSFDAVTVSHVIEHVYDPVDLLRECRRLLKPSGKVVVVTPNVASLGYRIFGRSWALLEPPRHLQLFSPDTLRTCAGQSGLGVEVLRTSSRKVGYVWVASQVIKKQGTFSSLDINWRVRLEGLTFQAAGRMACGLSQDGGEELVLVGRCETEPAKEALGSPVSTGNLA